MFCFIRVSILGFKCVFVATRLSMASSTIASVAFEATLLWTQYLTINCAKKKKKLKKAALFVNNTYSHQLLRARVACPICSLLNACSLYTCAKMAILLCSIASARLLHTSLRMSYLIEFYRCWLCTAKESEGDRVKASGRCLYHHARSCCQKSLQLGK